MVRCVYVPEGFAKGEEGISWKKYYLCAFNAMHAVGWIAVLLIITWDIVLQPGIEVFSLSYKHTINIVAFLQGLVLLEILHIVIGLLPHSTVPIWSRIYCKVVGRNHLLFGGLMWFPAVQSSIFTGLLIYSWALLDVIRYSYYVTHTLKIAPPWLRYLRYSAFLVQYPISMVFEVAVWHLMFRCMVAEDLHTLRMTVPFLNMDVKVFDHFYFAFFNLLYYVYDFPFSFYALCLLRDNKIFGKKALTA